MKTAAAAHDAAFLNELVADLRSNGELSAEVSQEVEATVRDVPIEGFVSDKMLARAWEGATGRAPEGRAYKRLRAEVFLQILASDLYTLDETKVKGDAANALRGLATTTPTVRSTSKFFEQALGSPVSEVDVSVLNHRIYLRTKDNDRREYTPGDGLAVLYREGEGEWQLELPDETEIELTKAMDPELLTAAERKTYAAARAAVREVLAQYLGLPEASDSAVRLQAPREDLAPTARQWVQGLLAALDALDGTSTKVVPAAAPPSVQPKELSPQARRVIRAFRDGELNFLKGRYETDYDLRKQARDDAQQAVERLVGFVAGDKSDRWGLEKFLAAPDAVTKASYLVSGFGDGELARLSDKHIRRQTLEPSDVPDFVRQWLRKNEREEQDLISIAGPHLNIPALHGSGVEAIDIDGQRVGYVQYYVERGWLFAAVFDPVGALYDGRCAIKSTSAKG